MSDVSTGSKSHAASEICKYEDKFSVWAREVPTVYRPNLKCIPSGPVADMVNQSQYLPEWLFKKDSSEYLRFKKLYPQEVCDLVIPSAEPNNTTSDSSVSTDLIHALPHIIHVVRRHIALREQQLPFNEADLRQPLDRLACHIWDSPLEPDSTEVFQFRSECPLKLPRTDAFPIPKAVVDSVSFFLDSHSKYTLMKVLPTTAEGISCMVNSVNRLVLPHWVTEYKGEISKLQEVERQVYYGVVSGLWQRRILGRMDDYVFGTAHAGSIIITYAARWEKRQTGTPNKDNSSNSKSKSKSSAPVATRSDTSNKSLETRGSSQRKKMLATDDRGSNEDKVQRDSDPTKDDHASDNEFSKAMRGENNHYQVVMYELKRYSTGNLLHMIQFYLLMRASRQLADQYRADIFGDKWPTLLARIEARSQFKWSPQPRSHSKNKSNREDILEHPNTGGGPAEGLAVGYDGHTRWAYEATSPEQEEEWKEEWGREQQSAVQQCGPGSLMGFKSLKTDTKSFDPNDHVSTYLASLC